MQVKQARANAMDWIYTQGRYQPGYAGAYFSGSINELSGQMDLDPSSDVDIVVVTEKEDPPVKLGKFHHKGTLLEITYLTWRQLASVEDVLRSYHLAGSFRMDTIIDDPTGRLHTLQQGVSQNFYTLHWVRSRCQEAQVKVETGLRSIDVEAPFHQQVMSWLFPTGVMTHVILVAALKNPTVRKRYLKAKEVLTDYGHDALYDDLLSFLGCADLQPQQVQQHLQTLRETFDKTVGVAKTPFFFSTDISKEARPIAIDGSQALIDQGYHREAVFWIIATFTRCHTILAADAPTLHQKYFPTFQAAVKDLGIHSTEDIIRRADKTLQHLPKLWKITEDILQHNLLIQK